MIDLWDFWGISWLFSKEKKKFPLKASTEGEVDFTKLYEPEIKTVLIPKTRPQTFHQYVGQEDIKTLLKNYISGIKSRKKVFPHTLIHGGAGMGKTSLAMLIAKELKVEYKEILGEEDPIKIIEIIKNLNGGILFIDEIHQLDTETAEKLYKAMEDFKINGEAISEFTLLGATTEMGNLMKRVKPFYDRFKIILDLESYTVNNLIRLLKNFCKRNYPKIPFLQPILREIAKNSRGTPRTSIRYLEALIFLKDLKKVFKSFKIIGDGYTEKDLKLLSFLNEPDAVVGVQGIASYLGISAENYIYEIEPYLLQTGVIMRTPRGRKITNKGISLVKKLEEMRHGRV